MCSACGMLWCFRSTPRGAALITGIKGTLWKGEEISGSKRLDPVHDIELQTSPFERHGSISSVNPISESHPALHENPLRKSDQTETRPEIRPPARELSVPVVMPGFADSSANAGRKPTIDRRHRSKVASTGAIENRAVGKRKGSRGQIRKTKKTFGQGLHRAEM